MWFLLSTLPKKLKIPVTKNLKNGMKEQKFLILLPSNQKTGMKVNLPK
uniref:Macaca fascicularis brain cDNA clone: QorA-14223, similar to human calmegin (CLGN), mRNA, RefSeq: NM_004362.1 n=1 Tax=Macaca fascicularis TaxID=9541 RepID=I7G3W2_MACFA|nr:unnamed protein product [Macaca fascicularis]